MAIVACGVMVSQALEAAQTLAAEGISASVVDMHTLKPLDGDLIDRLVASCGAIVTAEDHNVIGGLGGAVAEHLTSNIYAPLERDWRSRPVWRIRRSRRNAGSHANFIALHR